MLYMTPMLKPPADESSDARMFPPLSQRSESTPAKPLAEAGRRGAGAAVRAHVDLVAQSSTLPRVQVSPICYHGSQNCLKIIASLLLLLVAAKRAAPRDAPAPTTRSSTRTMKSPCSIQIETSQCQFHKVCQPLSAGSCLAQTVEI